MPRLDRTGPNGLGSRTGRKQGLCMPNGRINRSRLRKLVLEEGIDFGVGRGGPPWGGGRGFCWGGGRRNDVVYRQDRLPKIENEQRYVPTTDEEINYLEREKKLIERKINKLKAKSVNKNSEESKNKDQEIQN